ncbi:MAG: hypothetical protein PGN34_20710 [Methylobacterium frigidaeris]
MAIAPASPVDRIARAIVVRWSSSAWCSSQSRPGRAGCPAASATAISVAAASDMSRAQ